MPPEEEKLENVRQRSSQEMLREMLKGKSAEEQERLLREY